MTSEEAEKTVGWWYTSMHGPGQMAKLIANRLPALGTSEVTRDELRALASQVCFIHDSRVEDMVDAVTWATDYGPILVPVDGKPNTFRVPPAIMKRLYAYANRAELTAARAFLVAHRGGSWEPEPFWWEDV